MDVTVSDTIESLSDAVASSVSDAIKSLSDAVASSESSSSEFNLRPSKNLLTAALAVLFASFDLLEVSAAAICR